MPLLAIYKKRLAAEINSRALRADALETLACSFLSLTLLVGLGANAFLGWWWADPVAALAMVYFLIREGKESLKKDGRGYGLGEPMRKCMLEETRFCRQRFGRSGAWAEGSASASRVT